MPPGRGSDDDVTGPPSALAPLRHPVFRLMLGAWLLASLCMWMTEVAAAWLMTSLTSNPTMVALVHTAAALPIFLFGLPSGALADIVNRRRLLMFSQVWAALVAITLALLVTFGAVTPALLLVLVFANGMVLAMRWPAFSAIVPGLVPREQLPPAMALNGVANNGSRIVGPLLAGAILASAGTSYVFALTAVLSVLGIVLIARWKHEPPRQTLPSERMFGAIRVGIQHVWQSPPIQHGLVRCAAFFLHWVALVALLPLVARGLSGGGAGTYTVLLAAMGGGAVSGAFVMPLVARRYGPEHRVIGGTVTYGIAMAVMAVAPNVYVAVPAMLLAGLGFMMTANTMIVAAQSVLPDWVRARGLSMYQMVMMGATAFGAALWGQVAALTSVSTSLLLATCAGLVLLVATRKYKLATGILADLTPAQIWTMPDLAGAVEPHAGPVLVTADYRVDPERIAEFIDTMRESRRTWLAHGLLSWSLFEDLSERGHFIEHMVDESWASYLRRNERVSASYVPLRDRKHSFHRGPGGPQVTRYIACEIPD